MSWRKCTRTLSWLERVLSAWSLLPCQVGPADRSALWALLTFHGGACQLHLDRTCTHLVVPEPKGVSAHAPPSCVVCCSGNRVFLELYVWLLDSVQRS